MNQRRTHLSIPVVLGLLIGTIGLLLVARSIAGVVDAYHRAQGARRVAMLSLANAPLFASLTGERLTRGLVSGALLADAPVTPADFDYMNENRRNVDRNYADAVRQLKQVDLPGTGPVLERLRAAHDQVLAVRPAADVAIHLPKAARDPQIVHDEPLAIANLQATILATNQFLEDSVRLIDPLVDHLLEVRRAARAMRGAAGAIVTRIGAAVATGRAWTRADIAAIAEERTRVAASWKTVAAAAGRADAPAVLVDAAEQTRRVYFAFAEGTQQAWLDQLRQGRVPDLSADELKKRAAEALKAVVSVADAVMTATIERSTAQRQAAMHSLILDGAILAIALSCTVAGILLTHLRISRPVLQMTRAMNRLAGHDLSVALPGLGRGDEIGAMAEATLMFRDEMARADELERVTAEQRAARDRQAAELTAELDGMASRQGDAVETLVYGLMQLSEGDLTFSLPLPLAPEYEMMRTLFNDAVSGLHTTVQDVLVRAQAIGGSTAEIAGAADDLARRTERQATSLAQTAAALGQITATIRQSAAGSARAQALAAAAQADVERSTQVVEQTVCAMQEVEASAGQIGQTIGLINEIAFQTNLLALNAGVEAVRAGEAGRGFAVVASEVRALAQRAATAASEINDLVTTSIQHVARGVRMVGETGVALGHIRQGVNEINAAISEIAASAQEQSAGLAEVNESVGQMDQLTQQNAAMVEQSTAGARALAAATQEMQQAMVRFKIAAAEREQHAA